MSDRLIINKTGLHAYYWISKTKSYEEKKITDENIFTFLRESCDVEDGVTIGDIFRIVESLPSLKHFISQYSWCKDIDAFHEQAKLPPPIKKEPPSKKEIGVFDPDREEPENIDHANITHYIEVREFEGETTVEISNDFSGSGWATSDGELQETNYSLSYSPMNEIADLPIQLVEDIKVTSYGDKGKYDIVAEGNASFSLLDVLDSIYWDISFMGSPEANAKFVESLKATCDEIKEDHEKYGDDLTKALPYKYLKCDDVFRDLDLTD